MSRQLILLAVIGLAGPARADEPAGAPGVTDPILVTPPIDQALPPSEYDPSDQGIGAALGLAVGSRSTPGGLHVAGHYTYKMTATDWFDGGVAFTFGSGGAGMRWPP